MTGERILIHLRYGFLWKFLRFKNQKSHNSLLSLSAFSSWITVSASTFTHVLLQFVSLCCCSSCAKSSLCCYAVTDSNFWLGSVLQDPAVPICCKGKRLLDFLAGDFSFILCLDCSLLSHFCSQIMLGHPFQFNRLPKPVVTLDSNTCGVLLSSLHLYTLQIQEITLGAIFIFFQITFWEDLVINFLYILFYIPYIYIPQYTSPKNKK